MSADARSFVRGKLIGVALALAPGALAAQQDEHIFEPGKKHICVPAADRKTWNCGSADDPPAATPKPDGPALRSARAADLDESERAAAAAAAEAPANDPPASVAAPSSSPSRSVPSYLLSPEAAASAPVASSAPVETQPVETKPVETKTAEAPPPAAAEPVAAAPVVAEAPPPAPAPEPATVVTDAKPPMPEPPMPESDRERVVTQAKPAAPEPPTTISKPSVAAEPPPTIAAPPEPAVAAPPPAVVETRSERVAESKAEPVPAEPTPTPAPAPAQPSPPAAEPVVQHTPEPPRAAALRTADAFRTLTDARYVLELARGSDRATVEADAAQVPLSHGDIYLLPLQRDGASWYVAVWGDFDSIDSARAARSEALAAGNANVGWPRRVGPLKQELRLVR